MDTFTTPLGASDPLHRRYQTGNTLVESGATHTVLPASLFERLVVVLHTARRFVVADDNRVEKPIGRAWMRFDGPEDLSPLPIGLHGTKRYRSARRAHGAIDGWGTRGV